MNRLLEHFRVRHELVTRAISEECPGDRRAKLKQISDNIHRMILLTTAASDDGRDIGRMLGAIENKFDKLDNI